MTVDILENELVRKYFSDFDSKTKERRPRWAIARAVIKAMQEPIRKGERCLGYWFSTKEIEDVIAERDNLYPYHPGMLRLPDKFQAAGKKECPESIVCDGLTASEIIKLHSYCKALNKTPSEIWENYIHPPQAGKAECGCKCHDDGCNCILLHPELHQPTPEPEKHYCKFDPFGLGHCNGKSCLLPPNSCQCARREHESICPRGKPEKCYCIKYGVKGPFTHHSVEDCSSGSIEHKPSDAVESLIDKIVMLWSKQDDLILRLRELVKLARASNG